MKKTTKNLLSQSNNTIRERKKIEKIIILKIIIQIITNFFSRKIFYFLQGKKNIKKLIKTQKHVDFNKTAKQNDTRILKKSGV